MEVRMLSQALRLRRMLKNPLRRMSSQLTKSELTRRSISLLPMRLFV
jgi:hypothetical protein